VASNDKRDFVHALMMMPLNSSSGVDSRTALQYILAHKYNDMNKALTEASRE
jgi:hypothetical protein